MMKNKRTQRISFLISLALHGAVAALLLLKIDPFPKDAFKRKKNLEVELMDPEKLLEAMKQQRDLQNGQIVEQDHQLNDELDKNAKFLSKHNQKVVKETQAPLKGKFKNSDNSGGQKAHEQIAGKEPKKQGLEAKENQEQERKAEPKEVAKETLTSPDGVAVGGAKPKLKDLIPSFKPGPPRVDADAIAKGGGAGPSASDDHLKNVATGMQTMLSTREFVYYSYYNRIKDKLRQYWEPKIKEKMERILRQGRTIASSQDRITRIVIILDNSGTLVRVQVIGPSGVQDLDDAAVEAFRAAAPFPNPPKGIVDPDGTIKIRWDFILEANAGGLMRALRVAHRSE